VNQSFITGASNPNYVTTDGTYLYWDNYWDDGTSSIARANLDGSGVNQRFITQSGIIGGIAVDGTYLYWNTDESKIARANRDGSGINESFITAYDGQRGNPLGLAVDANYIYWSNCDFSQGCVHGDTIGRANLDGSGVNMSFISGATHTYGLAVDGTSIYWGDKADPSSQSDLRRAIGRANLDGSGANPSFISGSSPSFPFGVTTDGTYLYWADFGTYTIGRANLDGSGVDYSFITGANAPDSVAVVVPEPRTVALVIAGLLGLAGWRRAQSR
jgi:hypothetical protein